MLLKEPYTPRRITALEPFEGEGWRLKQYSILYGDKQTDDALIKAAQDTALRFLPQPATTRNHYGVGFISVHQGKSYDFVTIAYWTYDTELRHRTYMRPGSGSANLEHLTDELSTDVWDLRVLAFERDAWVETVLQADSLDLESYLARHLSETT